MISFKHSKVRNYWQVSLKLEILDIHIIKNIKFSYLNQSIGSYKENLPNCLNVCLKRFAYIFYFY